MYATAWVWFFCCQFCSRLQKIVVLLVEQSPFKFEGRTSTEPWLKMEKRCNIATNNGHFSKVDCQNDALIQIQSGPTYLTISPKLDIFLMFDIMCYQTKIKLYREKLHKFFMNNQETIKNEKFLHCIRCKTFIIQLGVIWWTFMQQFLKLLLNNCPLILSLILTGQNVKMCLWFEQWTTESSLIWGTFHGMFRYFWSVPCSLI